jgi:hypothetical protein
MILSGWKLAATRPAYLLIAAMDIFPASACGRPPIRENECVGHLFMISMQSVPINFSNARKITS